ncbi:MAG: hypothetical protein WCK02_08615 [Bacteroidota bacterium]
MKIKSVFINLLKMLSITMGFVYVFLGIILLVYNPIPMLLNNFSSKIFGVLALSYGALRVWRTYKNTCNCKTD